MAESLTEWLAAEPARQAIIVDKVRTVLAYAVQNGQAIRYKLGQGVDEWEEGGFKHRRPNENWFLTLEIEPPGEAAVSWPSSAVEPASEERSRDLLAFWANPANKAAILQGIADSIDLAVSNGLEIQLFRWNGIEEWRDTVGQVHREVRGRGRIELAIDCPLLSPTSEEAGNG